MVMGYLFSVKSSQVFLSFQVVAEWEVEAEETGVVISSSSKITLSQSSCHCCLHRCIKAVVKWT